MGYRRLTAHLASLALALSAATASAAGVEVVAHRGANEYAPENTYAAAKLCVEWGVEYVEIDVRTSTDGVMYILHDATVDRTTDGSGRISKLTSEAIDRLDAGSWFDPKFAGERVPRLEEYLRWIRGKAKVYFDVKGADLKKLIDLVYEVGLEKDCFFWFGNPLHVVKFRELNTELALKINVRSAADVERVHDRYGANIVEVGLGNMSQELVDAARERDIKVMVYHQTKDPEAFRQVIQWGADMINLNHGDVFKKVERELQAAKR